MSAQPSLSGASVAGNHGSESPTLQAPQLSQMLHYDDIDGDIDDDGDDGDDDYPDMYSNNNAPSQAPQQPHLGHIPYANLHPAPGQQHHHQHQPQQQQPSNNGGSSTLHQGLTQNHDPYAQIMASTSDFLNTLYSAYSLTQLFMANDAGSQEAGPQEVGPQEVGPQEAGPQEAGPLGAGAAEGTPSLFGPGPTDTAEPVPSEPWTAPVAPAAPTLATVVPAAVSINPYDWDALTTFAMPFAPAGAPANFFQHYTPINLAPSNASFKVFMKNWARQTNLDYYNSTSRGGVAAQLNAQHSEEAINAQINAAPRVIRESDLVMDHCDLQGIDWASMGTNIRDAYQRRRQTYRNYTSLKDSDCWAPQHHERMPPNTEMYFNFRQTHLRKNIRIPHFQLRNLLATASRSRAFFPGPQSGTVLHFSTLTNETYTALQFPNYTDVQISTIAAGQGVLVAGGFGGEYCVTNIDAEYIDQEPLEVKCAGSVTSKHESGISNHIQIHSLRGTSGPLAAFSSNDQALRVLDIGTNKIISDVRFDMPLNCSAISPDGRLRVVMGDTTAAYIVPASPDRATAISDDGVRYKPDILQCLTGHRDFGFSCAWADDGYTLATGSQDRAIKIWDARRWCNTNGEPEPIVTLKTQVAGARSLHFSPVGSGKRLLIAAEEADIVSIIDAQTFASRQAIEIFGEIAGVSLTPNGQDLLTLCADSSCGGLVQFERDAAWQAEIAAQHDAVAWRDEGAHHGRPDLRWRNSDSFDWRWGGVGHGSDVSPAARARRLRMAAKRVRSAAASRSRIARRPHDGVFGIYC